MTISTTTSQVQYIGNGVTTNFTFPFVGVNSGDISVILDTGGIITTLSGGQYTIVLNAVPPGGLWGVGGYVIYPISGSPLTANSTITILRTVPFTQSVSIQNQGAFYAQAVEQALDLLELQIQQVNNSLQGALIVPPGSSQTALEYIESIIQTEVNEAVIAAFKGMNHAKAVGWITPQQCGAFADGTAHAVTSQDITNNPQWIGTYPVGTSWDTVGIQEALYKCFAVSSTPGHPIWNSSVALTKFNVPFYVPSGTYYVNQQIVLAASGFQIMFASRLTTTWNWHGPVTTTMFFCNSISYGSIYNISLSTTLAGNYGQTIAPLWVMDHDGTIAGLATQQISIYDPVITVPDNGRGIAISPSGGASQGDTIVFHNLIANGFASDYAVSIQGQNSLSVTFIGGDIQGFQHDGIQCFGGSYYIYGMNTENQATFLGFTPFLSGITTAGADFHNYSGAGQTAPSAIHDVRSESEILVLSPTHGIEVTNSATAAAGNLGWFSSYPYVIGSVIFPGDLSGNNTLARNFMVVEDSGTPEWKSMSAGSTTLVIVDNTASYSVNQWVGYRFFFRFGNGFTTHTVISSNTATTITLSVPLSQVPNAGNLYKIGGITNTVEPNFDSCPAGFNDPFPGTSVGFFPVANNPVMSIPGIEIFNNISVNDYICVPNADTLGTGTTGAPIYPAPYVAKVIAKDGGAGTITLNKSPALTLSNAPGYWGTPIADNQIKYIELPFAAMGGVSHSNCFNQEGVVFSCTDGLRYGPPLRKDWNHSPANLAGNGFSNSVDYISGLQGKYLTPISSPLSTAATVDMTPYIFTSDNVTYTPTQNAALNFPTPDAVSVKEFTIFVVTSGTSSFSITQGTNVVMPTYATGTADSKHGAMVFRSNGSIWVNIVNRAPI